MTKQIEENTFSVIQVVELADQAQSVASFILKLYQIVNNPKNASIISWSQGGKSFLIKNIALFSQLILPAHFKHKNYQSFIRQLNMYSFAKSKTIHLNQYSNQFFNKQNESMLKMIKRRSQKKKKKQNIFNDQQKQDENNTAKCQKNEQAINNTFKIFCQSNILNVQKKIEMNQFFSLDLDNKKLIQQTSKWLTKTQCNRFHQFPSFISIKFFQNVQQQDEKQNVNNQEYIPKSITNITLFNRTKNSLEPLNKFQ